ncbi:hypothetical protein [Streptomyces sp. 142MFCol3.1]|uniref:hypothetical protein n=1 Tax=Streptomyces sp. 142MFCol3.1 TaxID=1172179 RepID=UPI0004098AB7|nr:hypothetical protein [Streptomyces sp. 142MFCol3.1]
MGERLAGEGRRWVHPVGSVTGPEGERVGHGLETALATALRGAVDHDAEQRAVSAYRAAREAGAHAARTRRRDNWSAGEEPRAGRPVRTTLAVLFASLSLGGVAVAAIGSVGSPSQGTGDDHAGKSPTGASSVPDKKTSDPSGQADRPDTAQDTEARCRAYQQVVGRGHALNSTAWQRLVTAAGGADKVAAYCAEQLARAEASKAPATTGRTNEGATSSGRGSAGNTGNSAGEPAGAGKNSGNGNANDGTGSSTHK